MITSASIIDRGIIILFLLIPFQWALRPVEGVDLPITRIYIILLFILWLATSLWKKSTKISLSAPVLFLISFLLLAVLSLLWAPQWTWGARKVLFLINFFLLIPVLADRLRQNILLREKIIKAFVIGAGVAALISLIQFFLQFIVGLDLILNFWRITVAPFFLGPTFAQSVNSFSSWLVEVSGQPIFRAIGLFPDPHIAAFYFGLILPWSILMALKPNSSKIYWLISIFILTAALATFSRGGYIGLTSGVFLVLILNINQVRSLFQKNKLRFILFLLTLASIFILIIYSPFFSRFTSSFNISEGSNSERIRNWKEALLIISEHPWGVGIGNYGYTITPNAQYRDPYYAHNLFLDIAAELGVAGLFIFIMTELSVLGGFMKNMSADYWSRAGIISLGIFFSHSLFETPLYSVHVLPLIIGIFILSTYRYERV